MAGISLYDYQLDAVKRMKNGCVLCGGVGSGKSRTALAYYYVKNGGELNTSEYITMDDLNIKDLYIITTARKRDTKEWERELVPFLLTTSDEVKLYSSRVLIDSWNNIGKYKDVRGAFFLFDEQRVVGSGAWVKAFLKIAKQNDWILLSATPGDTWLDYIPVFIANGFYKNRTEFLREHVIFKRFAKFPQVDRYINTGRLIRLRNSILIPMNFKRQTVAHHKDIFVEYSKSEYKQIFRSRWDYAKQKPIENASSLCYALRKAVNTSPERLGAVLSLLEAHPRVIIFYNFDYELEALRALCESAKRPYAEWNGHKHQEIPDGESWAYLVQYNAGAEGWNCVKTDTIIFFSQNYSYKIEAQACGRIDRLNTPYTDLFFYHLKTRSPIDLAISKALENKKKFNETGFFRKGGTSCY